MSDASRRPWFRSAALPLLAVLLLTACGGGDDGTAEAPDGTDVSDDAPADESSGALALTDADCRQYVEAFQEVPAIADPESLEGITEFAGVLDDAAGRMPDEVADDFRVIAEAYQAFGAALGDVDVDFSDPQAMSALGPEELAALQAASQTMGSAEVQEASANITTFLTEHCS